MNQHQRPNFRNILATVASQNAQRLMDKARLANRVAKSAMTARTRLAAYSVKTRALLALNRQFPADIKVTPDPRYGIHFVLVQNPSVRFGLHARASDFQLQAA
jgi:hypothetical protein